VPLLGIHGWILFTALPVVASISHYLKRSCPIPLSVLYVGYFNHHYLSGESRNLRKRSATFHPLPLRPFLPFFSLLIPYFLIPFLRFIPIPPSLPSFSVPCRKAAPLTQLGVTGQGSDVSSSSGIQEKQK